MLEHNQCYKKLGKAKITHRLFSNKLQDLIYSKLFDFDISPVRKDLILLEPLISDINKKIEIKGCGIMRLDPWKCYKWHTDTDRGASLNLLLTPYASSLVCFAEQDEDHDFQYHILKLEYEPETFYLFNNQVPHTVFNFENTRYLLSINFSADKSQLDFESAGKLINECIDDTSSNLGI